MTSSHTESASRIAEWLRANPTKWIQSAYNRMADGTVGYPLDRPDAECYCLTALIWRFRANLDAFRAVLRADGYTYCVSMWNDETLRTVNDVIELCERVASLPDEEKSL